MVPASSLKRRGAKYFQVLKTRFPIRRFFLLVGHSGGESNPVSSRFILYSCFERSILGSGIGLCCSLAVLGFNTPVVKETWNTSFSGGHDPAVLWGLCK